MHVVLHETKVVLIEDIKKFGTIQVDIWTIRYGISCYRRENSCYQSHSGVSWNC